MKTQNPQESSLTSIHQFRVRFNEVDALGIVWHGHYISYFEEGREAFGREFGLTYLDAKRHGFATPIVKMSSEHQLPLKYGDCVTIETTYINTRAAKLSFAYRIVNDNRQTVCTGTTTQVFTALDTGDMALSLPEFFRSWKAQHGLLHD